MNTERPQDSAENIFELARAGMGQTVRSVKLGLDDDFCFSCHRRVSCWNVCCHGADVTLTPCDILRLTRQLGKGAGEFLAEYTVPAVWDRAGLPVAKLRMGGKDGKGPCPFLSDGGCAVYDTRPVTCRYYPLGLAAVKHGDSGTKEDFHFMVGEDHCKGHDEDMRQTVAEFREEQGIEDYDRVNRGWIDILMKMASWSSIGGPGGKDVSNRTKKMFFMVSTDAGVFRRFVFESKFLDTYEVDPEALEIIKTDDEALLLLGFDWLKNIIFNEPTIKMKEQVLQQAIAKARTDFSAT